MIYRHVEEFNMEATTGSKRPDFSTLNAKGKDFLVF